MPAAVLQSSSEVNNATTAYISSYLLVYNVNVRAAVDQGLGLETERFPVQVVERPSTVGVLLSKAPTPTLLPWRSTERLHTA